MRSLKPPLVSYYQKPYARAKARHHLRGKLTRFYWRVKRNQPERGPMDWEHQQDWREGINLTPSTLRHIGRRLRQERAERAETQ